MSNFVEDCLFLTPKSILRGPGIRNDISCWSAGSGDKFSWFISIGDGEPEEVAIDWTDIFFGKRAYFICPACGRRTAKLFLPPGGKSFRCRHCHRLKYQLAALDPRSVAGAALYKVNRVQKLADRRADISRIFYKGEFTHRFKRFVRLCERAGLDSIVKGLADLESLAKSS